MRQFVKSYTRDFTLLAGQAWLYSFADLIKDMKPGLEVPYIEYRTNRTNEYWEDGEALQKFMDALYEENSKGRAFYDRYTGIYESGNALIDTFNDDRVPTNISEFADIISKYFASVGGWSVMYFSGIDERTPAYLRTAAQELRARDALGDNADEFMRRILKDFFGDFSGLEMEISFDELRAGARPDSKALALRSSGSVMQMRGDALEIVPGTLMQFQAANPELHFEDEIARQETTELQGQIGYRGLVRGAARVVVRRDEMDKVKEGEIIISTMTTPHFIPAMKRAAAFVTDEGGITCHAAIVAREMKKPCVIGTKFATQVFKNGDIVEVDANTGIVRKL